MTERWRWVMALVVVAGLNLTNGLAIQAAEASYDKAVEAALSRAGKNREQIQRALQETPANQRRGMRFLVAYMPDRDLQSLSADFLLENVRLGYASWNESPWKDRVSEEVFLNYVLPYANVTEPRDAWRKDFRERFQPLVRDAKTPSEAAAILNQKIFPLLQVKYSTGRKRADQSPKESIESGLASCTGLSIVLIDACRSIGVPARFVGIPLWADGSGNHSWVEVWDEGWHFTGAAEPTGDQLDRAWFLGRAAKSKRDSRRHAIYAVSYKRTPLVFPMVWNRRGSEVFAVNVTDRYTERAKPLPEGQIALMFRSLDSASGNRCSAQLTVRDNSGKLLFEGTTKDERFDTNDHLTATLPKGAKVRVEVRTEDDLAASDEFTVDSRDQPVTLKLKPSKKKPVDPAPPSSDAVNVDKDASAAAVDSLTTYLKASPTERPAVADQPFARVPLSRKDAQQAGKLLWNDHVAAIRETRADEMKARELVEGALKMPFFYKSFGTKPNNGHSLYISMHGGGGTTKRVNDGQWENQKRLYKLEEGIYVAPRAPTNTWNLWHQAHIDRLFARLIENMIVFEEVDPDRVYLMGYSAGGDGVFQLAPRLADRFAAAAMMAGHPNETSPLGLRNLPFTLHVGGRDAAYKRNQVAADWKRRLAELREADPKGYPHLVKIYPNKGHWMDREDAAAIPWMAEFSRRRAPEKVVWKQDDVTHTRFYWLSVAKDAAIPRTEVIAERDGQRFEIESKDVKRLTLNLSDDFVDLDRPIEVSVNGNQVFAGSVPRTIMTLARTLKERGDPRGLYSAELTVDDGGDSEKKTKQESS